MNAREIESFMKELAPVIRGYVTSAVAPLQERLSASEAREQGLLTRIAQMESTQPSVAAMINERMGEVLSSAAIVADAHTKRLSTSDTAQQALAARIEILEARKLPTALKGDPGENATDAQIADAVAKHLEAHPPLKGDPGEPGKDAEPIAEALEKSMKEVLPGLAAAAAKIVGETTKPPAPMPIPTFLIDQDGNLVMVSSDGSTKSIGRVRGSDGSPAPVIAKSIINDDGVLIFEMSDGHKLLAGRVVGEDGLGVADLDVAYDGERTITLRWLNGEKAAERSFVLPIVIDRGVHKSGAEYKKGDAVSSGGSMFIAQKDTTAAPETDDWRLAVKRGREGKPGLPGKEGAPGRNGRDMGEMFTRGPAR